MEGRDKLQTPYLSFVVTSRNDGHGGDIGKRMRLFMKALIDQCNKFKLPCELIMVEWNPPADKPLLSQVLPQPTATDYLKVRYVIVPAELHNRLAFSANLSLFQMIAKNVGIRRAHAKFVVCTNIDLIFSDELFIELSKRTLSEDCFYRANRCDVPSTLDEDWPIDRQLIYCKSHILKRNGKNALYPNFTDTRGFMFRYLIFKPFLVLLAKLKWSYKHTPKDVMEALDLDACGDFTLMSKDNWIKIQGYPELEMYSLHIDSMGVIAAAAIGLKQVIFNPFACTYHMEHTGGWEFNTPIDRVLFYSNKPVLDWSSIREAGIDLISKKAKFNINRKDWGFADLNFREIVVN